MNVFTYGTLMFSEVWQRVVQGTYASERAVLAGYARRKIKGAGYPIIFPQPDAGLLTGRLYFDVSDFDMVRLDAFEGSYYRRSTETVRLPDARRVDCDVYVLKNYYAHLISPEAWEEETFARDGLQKFLAQYFGFARLEKQIP